MGVTEIAEGEGGPSPSHGRRRTTALFGIAAVSLWLLRSPLEEVYAEIDKVTTVDWRWIVAIVVCEATAFVASWQLHRLALRTSRWEVAVAQLAGNAASNVVPGGGPVGAAVQLKVLSEAGFDLTASATALGASSLLGALGLLALPVIALPLAVNARHTDARLQAVLWAGVALLLVCILVALLLLRRDGPLAWAAARVQWIANHLLPRRARRADLPTRVLAERDAISTAFQERPARLAVATLWRPLADCAALYLSLLAVGSHPRPITVLVAFGAANVAGMIPITPGGLGFVEVGLTGVLIASGIDHGRTVLAVAIYRLASTWLPVLLGLVGYVVFRVRLAKAVLLAATDGAPTAGQTRRSVRRRLAVPTITVVALVLVSPVLGKVYRHLGDTFRLGPGWLVAIAAMVAIHFLCAWSMYGVVLRTRPRFDIAASQLVANATSHLAPAGSAVGAGVQLRMLTLSGFPASQALTALGASSLLGTIAGYLALPLIVLFASAAAGGIPSRLVAATWSAAVVLAGVLVGAATLVFRDTAWRRAARVAFWAQRRLHLASDEEGLAARLICERDLIRGAVRHQAGRVIFVALAQPLSDYAAFYFCLLAVGLHVNPAAAMAAFIVSNVAGLVPLTPGGLGFVEAGLVGVLAIAGAARPEVRVAVVTYRLAATWIPCLAGFGALVLFQKRHRGP